MKKFQEQVKEEFQKAFAANAKFFEDTKSAKETDGTFEMIISTQGRDRDGDVVLQDGIDITNYMNNPVVLFGHNYWDLPIGKTIEIIREATQTIAKGVFASAEANPFAQQVRKLYDAGIIKTASIGFIPREYEGNLITKCELLEWSFVPVPANPEALDNAKSAGLEVELKSVLAYAREKGVKMHKSFENYLDGKKKIDIDDIKEAMKKGFDVIANAVKEQNDTIKSLTADLSSIKESLASGTVQSGKEDLMDDVHKSLQTVDRIIGQVNAKINQSKK